jgi:hypothetical protein
MRGERREKSRTAIWRPPAGQAHLIRTTTVATAPMCRAKVEVDAHFVDRWLQWVSRLSSTISLGNHMSNLYHPLVSYQLRLSVASRSLEIVLIRKSYKVEFCLGGDPEASFDHWSSTEASSRA